MEESRGGTAELDGTDTAQLPRAPREEVALASQENCSFFSGRKAQMIPSEKLASVRGKGLGKRSTENGTPSLLFLRDIELALCL